MNMKTKIVYVFALMLAVTATSCMQSPSGEKVKSSDAIEVGIPSDAKAISANLDLSSIEWLGTKPTGTHFGTLGIKDGTLYLKDGKLYGGDFTMDMNAITVLDIKDEKMNQNLANHLRSADFFFVDSFPTANFKFSSLIPIENAQTTEDGITPTHRIEGNLTMRGVTRKVNFPAQIEVTSEGVSAKTPQFILNRTEWNVNYGSKSIFANLKDNFINDEMGVKITLKTK